MNLEGKPKDTETIDRLFLELSQFTKAKTNREIELENIRDQQLQWGKELTAQRDQMTKEVQSLRRQLCDLKDVDRYQRGYLHGFRYAMEKAAQTLKNITD